MKTQFNIIESSQQLFTDEVIKTNSLHLEEGETEVRQALEVIIPIVLYGLAEKSATWYGISEISQRATDAYNQQVLIKLNSLLAESNSSYLFLLTSMFGNKSGFIVDSISKYANIKYPSTSSLISLTLYATLGLLGSYKATNHTSTIGLAALLISEKNNVIKNLPPHLCLVDAEDEVLENVESSNNNIQFSRGWLFGVITIIGSIAFWGWLFVNRKEHNAKIVIVNNKDSVNESVKKGFSITNNISAGEK